jgi:hypothetical protein
MDGSRIRHRPPPPHVRPLPVAMVRPSLVAGLVPGVGPGLGLPAASYPAAGPAVDLPAITTTTDEEDRPTTRTRCLTQTLHPTLAAGDAATDGTPCGWSDFPGNEWPLTSQPPDRALHPRPRVWREGPGRVRRRRRQRFFGIERRGIGLKQRERRHRRCRDSRRLPREVRSVHLRTRPRCRRQHVRLHPGRCRLQHERGLHHVRRCAVQLHQSDLWGEHIEYGSVHAPAVPTERLFERRFGLLHAGLPTCPQPARRCGRLRRPPVHDVRGGVVATCRTLVSAKTLGSGRRS